jgi:hypothetical protein
MVLTKEKDRKIFMGFKEMGREKVGIRAIKKWWVDCSCFANRNEEEKHRRLVDY